jgi:septum site-determining protein MinC
MSSPISIKGSREGLRLQFDESVGWEELLGALQTQLERGAQFFNGAHVVVDIGVRTLSDTEMTTLLDLMRQHGLQANVVMSASRETRTAARTAGLTARPTAARQPESEDRSEAIVIQRTLRSGQVIRHQGHITVIGDINPGAEVIAGGSIIVWGRVRGTIHAGALGDRTAVICALDLRPTQLRIADLITRSPDDNSRPSPEIARVEGEQISVEGWQPQRR